MSRTYSLDRRQAMLAMLGLGAPLIAGCIESGTGNGAGAGSGSAMSPSRAQLIWGRFGYSDGRFNKPRSIAIDAKDQLYIVDMTARIQVFERMATSFASGKHPHPKTVAPRACQSIARGASASPTRITSASCFTNPTARCSKTARSAAKAVPRPANSIS